LSSLDDPTSALSELGGQGYEPWLLQTLFTELSEGELGVAFIYSLLEKFAQRHGLSDVIVVLSHESFGTQSFRLGGRALSAAEAAKLGSEPAVHCEPDKVPSVESDAVRTVCQLVLSMHLARFSAGHDALTTIENKRSFEAALQVAAARSARYGWGFTLVLIDLNDFKNINDRAGHPFGDHLLRQFGFALRRSVRSGDTAARIGGDEFGVILSNAEGQESTGFTERLRTNLKGVSDLIDFTVGIATSPHDSSDPEELKRIADQRLYEKKGDHR
jgi:diguanylate cyclase (GGDEF)-like protein